MRNISELSASGGAASLGLGNVFHCRFGCPATLSLSCVSGCL